VHVEDLAQAYALAVQKIHVAKGEVFNIVELSHMGTSAPPSWSASRARSTTRCVLVLASFIARSTTAIESKLFSLGFALLVLFAHTQPPGDQ